MRSKHSLLALALVLALVVPRTGSAAVPRLLGYHGRLKLSNGAPVLKKTRILFSLHDKSTNGTKLWSEFHDVTPDTSGFFDVILGSKQKLPTKILQVERLYLQLQVGQEKLTPRQRVLSSAFTLQAASGGSISIEGSADIDRSYGETIRYTMGSSGAGVIMKLRGERFTVFHKTYLPGHGHDLTGVGVKATKASTGSGGGHDHKTTSKLGSAAVNCGSAGGHTHATSVSVLEATALHSHGIRTHNGDYRQDTPKVAHYKDGWYFHYMIDWPQGICKNSPYAPYCRSGHYFEKNVPVAKAWPMTYYTSEHSAKHKHNTVISMLKDGAHTHSCGSHGHTISVAVNTAGAHTHALNHGHDFDLKVKSSGAASGLSLVTTEYTCPNRVTVLIDGVDCTADVEEQANQYWSTTNQILGDGTCSHYFVTQGTGPLDLSKFKCPVNWSKKGEHSIVLRQAKSATGGGKVRYSLIVGS